MSPKIIASWVGLLALICLIACKSTPALTPTAVPAVPTAAADQALESLATSLGSPDLPVKIIGLRQQSVFAAEAWRLSMAGQPIFAYEYTDDGARAAETAMLSSDGYQLAEQPLDWPDTPHFWQNGRFLIQYLGNDIPTLTQLTAILGAPITRNNQFGLTQLFSSPEGGFSLLIPANWQVQPPQTTAQGMEYQLGNGSIRTSRIILSDATQPLTDLLPQLTCADCPLPEPRPFTLDTGLEVRLFQLKNSDGLAQDWYVFDHDKQRMTFSINSDDGTQSLSAIIHTLTLAPETAVKPEETIPGVQLARQDLANQFGLDPYKIRIKEVKDMTWRDTCLEIVRPGLTCEPTPTPGYEITLMQGPQDFIYRSNADGTLVLITLVPGM